MTTAGEMGGRASQAASGPDTGAAEDGG
jgi:hypothetical protein